MSTTAVVLAAGAGARLRASWPAGPKPLLPVGGRPLLEWSLRALRGRGVSRIVVVAGFAADQVRAFAAGQPGVEVVENHDWAENGTLGSLTCGLRLVEGAALALEGDILYDPAGLDALLAHPAPSVLLASGPTGAGDEVWVAARDGWLTGMSKQRAGLDGVVGELVGIARLSAGLREALLAVEARLVAARGRQPLGYEVDGLVGCARVEPIAVHVEPGLVWGEVDDAAQHDRVVKQVWPRLRESMLDE